MTQTSELSRTVEDYLKQTLLQQQRAGTQSRGRVPMGRLAKAMNVTAGTGTAMVKRLADAGLLDYAPYDGVRLTARGQKLAAGMVRRHRLIETFLVQTLGLDWSEVHDEAERLEHAISDKLLEKIDAALGHPRFDPHGDPIPDRTGTIAKRNLRTLAECETGDTVTIARILDQRSEFLDFLDRAGLRPETRVRIASHDAVADALQVKPEGGAAINLGSAAAGKLLVR
jgi:DtxR family Mn-dependent transcriptional regulator